MLNHKIIRRTIYFGLLFTLFPGLYVEAATGKGKLPPPITLHFRFDSSVLDSGCMDNRISLRHLDELITDSALGTRIDSIHIYAFASPEGDTAYNERLALERAVAVKGYLVWKYPSLSQYRIRLYPQGENWKELYRLAENDSKLPAREEVLKIIGNNTDPRLRKKLLMQLDGGIPYRYLQENTMRYLRNAAVCMIRLQSDCTSVSDSDSYDTGQAKTSGQIPQQVPCVTDENIERQLYPDTMGKTESNTLLSPAECATTDSTAASCDELLTASPSIKASGDIPQQAPEKTMQPYHDTITTVDTVERRPLFALKTNLLFDVALMPNVELEVPIGKRWSVNGEYMFPWWVTKNNQYCLQILSGGLEGRYWLGSSQSRQSREVLTGHFIGLYAGAGEYDLQWKEGGYQGEFFIAAGLSYGWAKNIARNLHLEMSIGIGFMQTDYRHYHAVDNYKTLLWQENGKYRWIGPTKAKISLVWMLNRKVKMGGAR